MIAAIGKNNELGQNNKLIWTLKRDLQFFKNQTMRKPIVMGYNTFQSLPRLLPGRQHIVLTTKDRELDPSIVIIHSKEELLEYIKSHNDEFMIIGGASIYEEMLEVADRLFLTEIDATCDEADSFFPDFNREDYECSLLNEGSENDINYKQLLYTKKR
jgi:dihydrofolate reductase